MPSKHEKMAAACAERRRLTDGKCEAEECASIGWCAYCYEASCGKARKKNGVDEDGTDYRAD